MIKAARGCDEATYHKSQVSPSSYGKRCSFIDLILVVNISSFASKNRSDLPQISQDTIIEIGKRKRCAEKETVNKLTKPIQKLLEENQVSPTRQ